MSDVSYEVGEADGVINERNVGERDRLFDPKVTSNPRHLLLREDKQLLPYLFPPKEIRGKGGYDYPKTRFKSNLTPIHSYSTTGLLLCSFRKKKNYWFMGGASKNTHQRNVNSRNIGFEGIRFPAERESFLWHRYYEVTRKRLSQFGHYK